MPKEPARRRPTVPPRQGPIRPGSPLYRMLEMIAEEIAREASEARPPAKPEEAAEGA